jgi:hypothetical protein
VIPADLQSEIAGLLYRIAPELREVYLLDSADLARPEPTTCFGYASRLLDPAIHEHLLATGQFHGAPAGVIVFATARIRQDASDFRRAMLEVALHEACHLLPAIPANLRTAQFGPKATAAIEAGHHQLVASPPAGVDVVLREDHGARFIRIAAHVWFRAVALGFVPAAHEMFAGWRYGLSHPFDYVEALEGEPLRMLHEDFATIERTPPPQRFVELWQHDLKALQEKSP